MVGRHRIAEHREHTCTINIAKGRRFGTEALEVRRLLDIRGALVPLEDRPGRRAHLLPVLVAFEDARVLALEHILLDALLDDRIHLFLRRPQLGEHHRLAVTRATDRVLGEVDVHCARERIRNDERWRPQVAGLDQGVDARLEVAVAGKDGDHAEVLFRHRRLDLGTRERAGVADARGAAVADEVEAQLLERFHQAGRVEVIGHHTRTRGEARLDIWMDGETTLHRVSRQQSRGDHDRRVRRVCAAGDGRDHHATVLELGGRFRGHRDRRASVDGAAFLGEPRDRVGARFGAVGECGGEALPHFGQRRAVLRPLGAGEAGLDLRQVELEQLGELRDGVSVLAEEALLFAVALDQVYLLAAAACDLQVAQRLRVDREQRRRRPVLGAHVAHRGAVGNRKARQTIAAELDELLHHTVLAQHLRERQHEVGCGRPCGQRSAEVHADHDWRREVRRLAEHRGLGLDAADSPTEHAEPVDHRRV